MKRVPGIALAIGLVILSPFLHAQSVYQTIYNFNGTSYRTA